MVNITRAWAIFGICSEFYFAFLFSRSNAAGPFTLVNYATMRPKRFRTWRLKTKWTRCTNGRDITDGATIFPRKPFCGGHWNVRPRSSERSTQLRGRLKDAFPAKQIATAILLRLNNVVIVIFSPANYRFWRKNDFSALRLLVTQSNDNLFNLVVSLYYSLCYLVDDQWAISTNNTKRRR